MKASGCHDPQGQVPGLGRLQVHELEAGFLGQAHQELVIGHPDGQGPDGLLVVSFVEENQVPFLKIGQVPPEF